MKQTCFKIPYHYSLFMDLTVGNYETGCLLNNIKGRGDGGREDGVRENSSLQPEIVGLN